MYVGRPSFYDFANFLHGYCFAIHDPLMGIQEWIEMRFVIRSETHDGRLNEWFWPRIMLHEYANDRECFDNFPQLFDEFTSDRSTLGADGIRSQAKQRFLEKYGRSWGTPDE